MNIICTRLTQLVMGRVKFYTHSEHVYTSLPSNSRSFIYEM